MRRARITPELLALVAVASALNLALGFIVATLKLPFYLDSIGTVIATCLGGLAGGLLTGVASVLIGSLYTPTLWAYVGTAVVTALYVSAARRLGYLTRAWATVLLGLVLGVVTAVVSAPVTTYLFGGVSFAGTDFVTAYLKATGKTLADSVLLGGLATDPVDKLFTSLIAFVVVKRLPQSWGVGSARDLAE